eukprot:g42102.t1
MFDIPFVLTLLVESSKLEMSLVVAETVAIIFLAGPYHCHSKGQFLVTVIFNHCFCSYVDGELFSLLGKVPLRKVLKVYRGTPRLPELLAKHCNFTQL